MFRRIFLILFLFLSACATAGKQTSAVLLSPPQIARAKQIDSVKFQPQKELNCGPAALAMVMNWGGHTVTVSELETQAFTKGKGSLQADLISASRRHGMLAMPIEGMRGLLQEVAADHPVIVLENLGFSWYPQWHYAVVVGYDLNAQEWILHSGERSYQRISMNYFERDWKLAEYWGLVVLPADKLAETVDEFGHMQAAAGLEQAGRFDEAEIAYQNILKKWPESFAALFGLGNLSYRKHNYKNSINYLRRALQIRPDSLAARHNLEVVKSTLAK